MKPGPSTPTSPAKTLDAWMSANGIGGDFTAVDTALLNRFFRDYYGTHGQGGTHTLQRNLIQMFNFLQREHGHPTPYTATLSASGSSSATGPAATAARQIRQSRSLAAKNLRSPA
jgi:hypothetical protein